MKKRGVTLIETVIAMFLLTIITGAAFTLCSRMVVQTDRAETKFRAQSACNDVIECFKVVAPCQEGETSDNFLSALQYININARQQTDEENNPIHGCYVMTFVDFSVWATVDPANKNKIEVTAKTVDGTILHTVSYARSGAY